MRIFFSEVQISKNQVLNMTVNTYYIFNPPFRHLPKAFKDISWLTWIIQHKVKERYDFYQCYFGK